MRHGSLVHEFGGVLARFRDDLLRVELELGHGDSNRVTRADEGVVGVVDIDDLSVHDIRTVGPATGDREQHHC